VHEPPPRASHGEAALSHSHVLKGSQKPCLFQLPCCGVKEGGHLLSSLLPFHPSTWIESVSMVVENEVTCAHESHGISIVSQTPFLKLKKILSESKENLWCATQGTSWPPSPPSSALCPSQTWKRGPHSTCLGPCKCWISLGSFCLARRESMDL
jgi:hypothetical protein